MPRPKTPEQLAKIAAEAARREAESALSLQETYELATKRGLLSESSVERAAALQQAGAMLVPNLGSLRNEIKSLTKHAEDAEAALNVVQQQRDTAQAILVIACQSALQGSAAKAELADLKTNLDSKIVEARKELVSSAQEHEWKAIRAENSAKELMESAQRQFSTTGLEALLEAMKRLVEFHKIPMPDIWHLPHDVNPLLLELWGWPRIKSQLFVGYTKSYPEPTAEFRQLLFKYLRARLPIHGTMPDPVEHLGVRLEVMQMMCARWPGVMESAQRQVDELEAQERGQAMLNNGRLLAEQQVELSRRGYGRSEIGVPQESETQTDPHHWNGFIPCNPPIRPVSQDDDPNEVQRVNLETLSYGNQLIEREAMAKKGKVVKVDPPESMTQSLNGDDEESF